ncbi:hypothetical protein SAMN05519103_00752 [Rhizobiales bacterium GAS113]|nr:hypothetical protein SAMN05519103_00752 [Rhizobiales bacterium GAS113]
MVIYGWLLAIGITMLGTAFWDWCVGLIARWRTVPGALPGGGTETRGERERAVAPDEAFTSWAKHCAASRLTNRSAS